MVPTGATNNKFVKMSPDCLTYGATSLIWKNVPKFCKQSNLYYISKSKSKRLSCKIRA